MEIPAVIIGTLICFYLYYYFASDFLVKKIFHDSDSEKNQPDIFIFKKISGFFFLGVIPVICYLFFISGTVLSDFGLRFSYLSKNILLIIGSGILVFIFVFLVNKIKGPVHDKPHIMLNEWTSSLFLVSCFGWILYLIGYETLFRGVLLIS